jgi:uncharacterized membrane protein
MRSKYMQLAQRPENAFFLLGLAFGLLVMLFTPPLQVPDEPAHFLRAYQVSEGKLFAERRVNRVGGEVPLSLEKFCHPFWLMVFPGGTITFDSLAKTAGIPLDAEVRKFKDFNNTALYPAVCYIPQAIGMCIPRLIGAPPFYIFYFGRLFNFFTWLFMIRFAILKLPFAKWLFATLALLPMSLYVNISLSADVLTNATAFLFIAVVLHHIKNPVALPGIRLLFFLALLLASVKPVNAVLGLLVFMIPRENFTDSRRHLLVAFSLLALMLTVSLLWTQALNYAYITYDQYDPTVRDDLSLVAGADMAAQLRHVLGNSGEFLNVVLNSIRHSFGMYFPGFIGTFGWLSLSLPGWLIIGGYISILIVSMTEGEIVLSIRQRLILLLTFVLAVLLLFLSQHLIWGPVGASLISNLQGRYFIPFAPVLFLLFGFKMKRKNLARWVTITYTVVAVSYTLWALNNKYYA